MNLQKSEGSGVKTGTKGIATSARTRHPEEEQQRRQDWNERDCARRENETPDEQLAGEQHRNERDCAWHENELILSRTIRIQPALCRTVAPCSLQYLRLLSSSLYIPRSHIVCAPIRL
jgi:hypothetical protein